MRMPPFKTYHLLHSDKGCLASSNTMPCINLCAYLYQDEAPHHTKERLSIYIPTTSTGFLSLTQNGRLGIKLDYKPATLNKTLTIVDKV